MAVVTYLTVLNLFLSLVSKRVTGQLYDDLIDEFIGAATAR